MQVNISRMESDAPLFNASLLPSVPPRISGIRSGANIELSWDQPGFILQSNATLSPSGWLDALNSGTTNLTVPANGPRNFFRLRSQ